jgi:hypothetical protein
MTKFFKEVKVMRSRAIGGLLVALMALLAIISGVKPAMAEPTTPDSQAVFSIIGDSYGSGNGAIGNQDGPIDPNPYLPNTTLSGKNFCLRSLNSAAEQAGRELGFAQVNIVDHSCSSATASNVLDEVQFDEGLQIQAFGPRTTHGVYEQGGNPWFMQVFQCMLTTLPALGQTCSSQQPELFSKALNYYANVLPDLTRRNLQAIHDVAPNLKALAVPLYPPVVPLTGKMGECAWFGDDAEMQHARELFDTLNGTIESVVAEFAQYNFFIVDPMTAGSPFLQRDTAGNGTDACSSNMSLTGFWLLRAGTPTNMPDMLAHLNTSSVMNHIIAGTLHPNQRGWNWMRDLIVAGFQTHTR